MKKYTSTSKWQEFLEDGWNYSCQMTGFTSEMECPDVMGYGRSLGDVTMLKAVNQIVKDRAGLAIAAWICRYYLDRLSDTLRIRLLEKVAKEYPAFCIILKREQDYFNPQELRILEMGIENARFNMITGFRHG